MEKATQNNTPDFFRARELAREVKQGNEILPYQARELARAEAYYGREFIRLW